MIRTGICGTDSFGCTLAAAAIRVYSPVLLCDDDPLKLDDAVRHVQEKLQDQVNHGALTPGKLRNAKEALHHTTAADECLADIIFLTEKNVTDKCRHLANINSPETIFIIRGEWEQLKQVPDFLPDASLSCWLFFPDNVQDLGLAEIVAHPSTSPVTLLAIRKFTDQLGMRVLGKLDKPGFITKKIEAQRRLEAQYIQKKGIAGSEQLSILLKNIGFSQELATPLSGEEWENASQNILSLGHALGDPERFRLP